MSQPYAQPPAGGGPYQPHPQQQPYGAPPQFAQPGAYAQPMAAAQPMVSCRLCGSVPAVATTFREHQGIIVLMRFIHLKGPFCRDCGLATFRRMTSRTLAFGWYSYASLIVAPITLLINLVRRGKVASLAAPQPNPYGPSRPPMDPGSPVFARPLSYVGPGVIFLLIVLIVIANLS